jgi:hypothetical protein
MLDLPREDSGMGSLPGSCLPKLTAHCSQSYAQLLCIIRKSAWFTGVYAISSSVASSFCCTALEFFTGNAQLCTEVVERCRIYGIARLCKQVLEFKRENFL